MPHNGMMFFSVDGPLLVPPPPGSIRAGHFLSGFKEVVRKLGGHHRKVLEKAEIDVVAADDPDYPLSGTLATAMLDQCSIDLNDDLFGLHLADNQEADVYGCLAALGRSAPTLRIGLESIINFLPLLHSPGADAELVTVGETAEYRWRPYSDFSCSEQAIQHGLLLAAKLLASLGGRDFQPSYVSSTSKMRRHHDRIERRFGCSVYGQASANSIAFGVEHLGRRLPTANPIVFGLVGSYLARVRDSHQPSLRDQIVNYVGSTLSSGQCNIDNCAMRLGTSPRTLQKRLTEMGTSFVEIVDEQRLKAAKAALLETRCTLDEITDFLGYSEKSSFCRAFKRWTNLSPQAFREREALSRSCGLN